MLRRAGHGGGRGTGPRGGRSRRASRRGMQLLGAAVIAAVLVAFTSLPVLAQLVGALGPIGMTVSAMEPAMAFYHDVLDFSLVSDVEVRGDDDEHLLGVFGARARVVRMQLGDEQIELMQFLTPTGRPYPEDSRSNDRWFQHIAIIVSDMDAAYARLRERAVRHASSGPQTIPDWNRNAGGIRAFYFKDPDGHVLEVLWFPPDKGAPRWHQPGDRLFLGIDHTAIVVRDTEASLAFYRDRLGFQVAGQSENYGIEQEHLNNVFGARLRITSLRAARGPAIEFLEYLSPADGRPYPPDAKANDLFQWQTSLVVPQLDAAFQEVLRAKAPLISPGPVTLDDDALGFGRGMLVRDPDGHALRLIDRAVGGGRPAAAR